MATRNLSLPAPMCDWFESQVENRQFFNKNNYVRYLIRKDQQRFRHFKERLPRALQAVAQVHSK